jgi:hypothetical protein
MLRAAFLTGLEDEIAFSRSGAAALRSLLRLSSAIDATCAFIGKAVSWLILAAVLVSAGNAVIRKAFDMSSNAWLELQWYLFAPCSCWPRPTRCSETSTSGSISSQDASPSGRATGSTCSATSSCSCRFSC